MYYNNQGIIVYVIIHERKLNQYTSKILYTNMKLLLHCNIKDKQKIVYLLHKNTYLTEVIMLV